VGLHYVHNFVFLESGLFQEIDRAAGHVVVGNLVMHCSFTPLP